MNKTVMALANGLAAAVSKDEAPEVGGFDLSAGMFGPNVSNWLRQVAVQIDALPGSPLPPPPVYACIACDDRKLLVFVDHVTNCPCCNKNFAWPDEVKQRAYTLDPDCWKSYSGAHAGYKRVMDRRRTASLTNAAQELYL